MIHTWHILISGFTQDANEPSGTEALWSQMRQLSSAGICVQCMTWKDDWAGLAERITRTSVKLPRVYIYAYSWGAGHGFTTLADELGKRGIWVRHAVLCDPVYRSRLLPTWLPFNPLSLMRTPKIRVPKNVDRVSWLRQKQNRPAGHDLKADTPATQIDKPILLARNHAWMDDAPEYHDMALRVAREAA